MSLLWAILLAALPQASPPSGPPSSPPAQEPSKPPAQPQDLTEMSLEDLMKVEITSVARKEQRLMDAPAAITVIRAEDIRRMGATTIMDALRMVPGLEVARLDSNQWAISARGGNGIFANKLLVLIDGRSVYSPLFSGVYWDVQDVLLEDVERIEVIRGPGATVWGANAVNGVINIITKKARDTQGGLVSAGAGTQERASAEGRYGGKIGDDLYYRVYVKYFDRTKEFNGTDDWYMSRAGYRIDWTPGTSDLWTLQGDYYTGEIHTRLSIADLNSPTFATVFNDEQTVSGGNLLGRWEHTFDSKIQLRAQFYYDRTQRDSYLYDERRDTLDFDLQQRFPLFAGQDVTCGVGYRWTSDWLGNSAQVHFMPDHQVVNLASAFLQDEIVLVENTLTLTLGSKFEYNDYTHFEYEPGVRLLYRPHEHHSLWAAATRAVRTPARFEEGIRFDQQILPTAPLPTMISVFGLPHQMRSEHVRAFELGYKVQPLDALTLDAAGFYNIYDRLSSAEAGTAFPEPSGAPTHVVLPLVLGNEQDGQTYGVEVAASYQALDWWRLQAAYTFLREFLHNESDSTALGPPAQAKANPRNQLYLRSSTEPVKNVHFDVMGRYVDSLPNRQVPHYIELDARLAWAFSRNFEAAIVGQNLLSPHHLEFRDTDLGIQASEIQRGVYFTLTWKF